MEGKFALAMAIMFFISTIPAHGDYYSKTTLHTPVKEKTTHLHFYLHDILSGTKPSAVEIAHANQTLGDKKNPTPFGSVFAIDDPLTLGPEPTSEIIGNARGMYLSSAQDTLALVMYVDFGFTSGRFNGSSISVFSRNPIMEPGQRELAVVGGRGMFRMARGFALLKTYYLNVTNGDAIIEYKVTLYHH